MLPEDIVINKAQTGDRDALNELVSIYWHPVYRFVTYKTGLPEEAQELTQETFFRAFRALPGYKKTTATFKTYLFHIALNLIRDYWRKQGRSPTLVDIADIQEAGSEADQPHAQALRLERRETIAKALEQLPCDQRSTIELRIMAGLPVRDTAIALGKSEAAIKMLQQRALKSLRVLLINSDIAEEPDWR